MNQLRFPEYQTIVNPNFLPIHGTNFPFSGNTVMISRAIGGKGLFKPLPFIVMK